MVKGNMQGRANLRAPSQVRHQAKSLKRERRIRHDEFYSTVELMYHVDNFIQDFAIGPELRCF